MRCCWSLLRSGNPETCFACWKTTLAAFTRPNFVNSSFSVSAKCLSWLSKIFRPFSFLHPWENLVHRFLISFPGSVCLLLITAQLPLALSQQRPKIAIRHVVSLSLRRLIAEPVRTPWLPGEKATLPWHIRFDKFAISARDVDGIHTIHIPSDDSEVWNAWPGRPSSAEGEI